MFEGEKAICFSGRLVPLLSRRLGRQSREARSGNGAASILGWAHAMAVKGLDFEVSKCSFSAIERYRRSGLGLA